MLTPGAFEDRRSSQGRLQAIRVLAMICFGVLSISFWVIQVIGNAKYDELATTNHLRTVPLRAPRGVFFDRNGAVLVENRYAYSIAVIRERSPNAAALAETIHRLAGIVGVDEARMKETLQAHKKDPLFQPIVVVEHANDVQVAAVMARRSELPELAVLELPVRAYPSGGMGAHMVGYVNEISPAQMKRPEYAGLPSGAMVGQAGLEQIYNARLMGRDGKKDVLVNSQNREVGEPVDFVAPDTGQRMQLTIDKDMQRALEEGYKSQGLAGAAVFLNPQTGEILATTSQPDFDPNAFADGIDPATWRRLVLDPDRPLTNRLIQNYYSPGSTFKVLMAIAGLAEGVIKPETTYTCKGQEYFYGRAYECDKKYPGHGTLDLRHAIQQSCNVYFFHVGQELEVDRIRMWAERLGLAGKTGIDLPEEVESIIPSTEWKLRKTGEPWYKGETISVAIGQGQVTVTPIALATMMATVANGGTIVTPHLVKAVDEGQGWRPIAPPAPRGSYAIRPEVLKPVIDGLWMVVNETGGTGSKARLEGHDVVGKTGTAQVISKEGKAAAAGKTEQDLGDNSWFVFFAPRDSPRVAGVVFVEHGGHGGTSSAPIVRHVLDTYFAKQEGRPLPTLPVTKVVTPAATRVAPAATAVSRSGGGNRD